jgi:hypothetical protein
MILRSAGCRDGKSSLAAKRQVTVIIHLGRIGGKLQRENLESKVLGGENNEVCQLENKSGV